jgi:hypothetical protein
MPTPVPMDLFNRFMVTAFDEKQVMQTETVGQCFFGNPATGSRSLYSPDANVVEIEIKRAGRRTAALIPRGTVSQPLGGHKDMSTEKGTTFSRKYPLSQEQGDIASDQLSQRLIGTNAYSGLTRVDVMRALALEYHYENINRHVRLFERLAWTSLLTGKMPAILATTNTDLIYDFRRASANTITPAHGWGNAAGYPLTDIALACDKIRLNGKMRADGMFIGGTTLTYLLGNTQFLTQYANKQYFDLVQFRPGESVPPWAKRLEAAGAIIWGKMRIPPGYDLVVLTYPASYSNESDVDTKFMPDDEAFVFSSGARCDRYFGPPDTLPMIPLRAQWYMETFGFNPMSPPMPQNILGAVVDPAMFYVDAFPNENQTAVTLRTQSAPIFATTHTDAFVEIKAVGNAA